LAMVGEGRGIGEYRKDQIVFSQGDPADAVFYIQSGRVKVTVVSEQGKEAVVAMLGTNDFFGEGCLAGQARRIATVATMMDSVIVRLEKAAIVRVIHQQPAFSGMFMAHLLARAIRVEADLVDQLFNSSEKRLARLLLLMANFGKEAKPEPLIAKISQETLADMIGTTRSHDSGVELSPTGTDRRGGPRTASNRTVRASSAIAAGSTRWLTPRTKRAPSG